MHSSDLQEEGNRSEDHADSYERSDASDEVRDADEKQPSDEWNDGAADDGRHSTQRPESRRASQGRQARCSLLPTRGLTFALSRMRRLAKPAVACRSRTQG